ncbi:hypothetical protein ASPWEDRAFT_186723 [Aspergillus wentii DTO 134E9]|uniref:BTB domain-containing protein n=1 Tax=Aspergillus wentii DTO 134E9 TaxID=1073089 RepID=A0A1L9RC98_ASPWE|nr:uncharacterized protein ASPWEDRAFT_186723 [Aspergillus wentii DTO 134E9]KAI9935118.1 hypothetical protein MW887_000739 [Aspergillus wentii]OJJ32559.1 hypothetical protein ASPWEDRAFT_186723 [Aspergillus wentii DTO 134E9]
MASPKGSFGYIDFLDSEMVALGTSGSSRSFKIHKGLLGAKCRLLHKAIEGQFKEGQPQLYVCQQTSEGTLVRFIEWAYKGDYPDGVEEHEIDPLLSYAELYAFSDVYGVSDLKKLTYEKLTGSLHALGKPQDLKMQIVVITMLEIVANRLPSDDTLVNWLAKYTAWCIDHLRGNEYFDNLCNASPSFCLKVMNAVNPAPKAPWTPERRGTTSRLSPNSIFEDDY